jgi:hypothetical protein
MFSDLLWRRNVASQILGVFALIAVSIAVGCTTGNGGGGGIGGGGGSPSLAAAVVGLGSFSSGEQGAAYTITVSNSGNGATSGTVTVADPPTGFTVTAISGGATWTCALATTTCTNSNLLAAGQSFATITVIGNVKAASGTPVTIPLVLSGGGATTVSVTPTPSVPVAAVALGITKSHTGNFTQGQQGATYTVKVSNGANAGTTSGMVTVTEMPPSGLAVTGMAGPNGSSWACVVVTLSCTRSDALTGGSSYDTITVTVNVAANATSPQVNKASVSGGNQTTVVPPASDSTTITVTNLTLVSITLTPANPLIPIGQTQQFKATGTYSDNSTHDLTATATWSSSTLGVATVSNGGLASSVGQGQATIEAALGSISGSTALTVGPASFTSTGSLITGRYSHTATLLNNGKLLITGGSGGSSALASAELYDPSTAAFATTGSLTAARYLHTATLLKNGMVLVVGGQFPSLASAELYNPTTGTFTATGSLSTARGRHTATLLNNGTVLITGGFDSGGNGLASAEVYDLATGSFTATGSMGISRAGHTATLLNNGMVLISGGISSNFAQSSSELYNPTTGTFSFTGNMLFPRTGHTATLLNNGSVLVAGGSLGPTTALASAELYNPVTGAFTTTGSLSTARGLHSATLLDNGMVLIAGGYNPSPVAILASAEVYDPGIGVFSATGSLNTARFDHTGTRLSNGTVLIVGGYNLSSAINTAELFDAPLTPSILVSIAITPANSAIPTGKTQQFKAAGTYSDNRIQDLTAAATWSSSTPGVATINSAGLASSLGQGQTTISATSGAITGSTTFTVGTSNFVLTGSLSNARWQHTATLLNNGKVMIAGGNVVGAPLDSVQLYDPAAGTFNASGTLIAARSNHTATLLSNGMVLIAGGLISGSASTASAELYNPATGTFTSTGSMITSRAYHTATLLPNGGVLIAGGETLGGGTFTVLTSAELYDPATGTFTATGILNTARSFHTATLLKNGMVMLAGGYNNSSGASTSAELYNPIIGTFAVTGSLNTPRYGHTAVALSNGMVMIAGGVGCTSSCGTIVLDSAELYNPVTGIFSGTGGLNSGRSLSTATLLNNGMVLIAGGSNSSGAVASGELYDSVSGTFTAAGNLNTPRYGHTATLLNNGTVLISAGVDNSTYLTSDELFY